MTISEAGACATPAVVSRIAGHVDAVDDQVSGLVVDSETGGGDHGARPVSTAFAQALRAVLTDRVLRARLGHGRARPLRRAVVGHHRLGNPGSAGGRGRGREAPRTVGRCSPSG